MALQAGNAQRDTFTLTYIDSLLQAGDHTTVKPLLEARAELEGKSSRWVHEALQEVK